MLVNSRGVSPDLACWFPDQWTATDRAHRAGADGPAASSEGSGVSRYLMCERGANLHNQLLAKSFKGGLCNIQVRSNTFFLLQRVILKHSTSGACEG
ncbi:putative protein BBD11 [Dissostichus eleginoides]|uniref:Uncharacterized protein n=1 Tax=Dissostichus eleginoides TaxID=100907 RepID=A0AAD9CI25_DISEL|nr:putative protein BBD11 [Dissostichus eleginoides]